ncbi:glutamic acid-rich protein-like [Chelonus insularis]|uniref:glutamic acid-rich protein-like n=1 Tax=Chelonus insularis TaxID=460826 RepID=UPI00158E408D|nr:glutamic acid-rich protein-like [Chelonus insularis]
MEIPVISTRQLIKEIRHDLRCILSDYKKIRSDQQSKKLQSDSESSQEAIQKRKDLLHQLRKDSDCMDQNLKFIEKENQKRRKDLIRNAGDQNAKLIPDENLMKREYVRYTFGYGFAIPRAEYLQTETEGKHLKTTDAEIDVNMKHLQKLEIIEAKTDDSQEETENSEITETKTETEEEDSQEDTEEKDSGITGTVSEIESEDSQDDTEEKDSGITETKTKTEGEDSQENTEGEDSQENTEEKDSGATGTVSEIESDDSEDDSDEQDTEITDDETDSEDAQELKRRIFEILEIFALAEMSRQV